MSYKNHVDTVPLVAVFNSSASSTSSAISDLAVDTSLYSGVVSNDTLSISYACTLRGDFYGSVSTAIPINCQFIVDGTEGNQSRESSASFGGGNIGGSDVFYTDADSNQDIGVKYRSYTSVNVTTSANFPRVTGVLKI